MSRQANLQITQLRTKLIKQKQEIEEKDKQIERQEEDIIELQLQKDSYIQQVRLVQQEFDKYRQDNQNLVEQKIESTQKGQKNFEHDIKILEDQNKKLQDNYDRAQADLYDEKERGKSQRDQIKQLYKKINDPSYKVDDHETYLNEKIKLERDLKERTRNLEQLRRDMEDILAENRILRKLAEVPDNYGFDLEEIKLAEQEKIENYKQKVRYLEGEVEDLEKERTHLRAKLRTATLKKGGAAEIPDEYSESYSIIKKLEQQVKVLEEKCEEQKEKLNNNGKGFNNKSTDDGGQAAEIQKELLEKVTALIEKNSTVQFQPKAGQMHDSMQMQGDRLHHQQDMQGAQQQSYQGKYAHHGRPPHHLSGRYGDEANITNGFSHRFGEQEGQGQKLAVHLDRLYSESGFDQVQAKQEIATLQLMNLENMKIIEEKEKEYSYLHQEMRELTDEYTKMLMIQDALFEQHFDRKTQMQNEITRLKDENDNFIKINSEQKLQIMDLQKDIDIVKSKDAKTLNDRLAEMVEIKAKLEVNLIQLARKYDCLQADYQDMNQKYVNVSKDYSEKEQKYIHRIQNLIDWKNRANHQLKILLEEQKKSVPEDEYTNLVERERDTRDKLLASMNDNSSLKIQLGQLRGAEREIQEKNEIIQEYEEEMIDINMEMEVIKKRLEEADPVFGKFQECFRKLVETIKRQNLTPYQVFQLMDGNKDGQLSKTEFTNILEKLGVPLDPGEIDVIFLFLDLDGSENIDYNEFLRRLRRSGVTMRRKEEEIIYELYQKIMNVGWNLRDLFETMDVDGNNDITQEELKKGLNTVNIQITDDDVNEIFKMADTSGDGAICYDEFRILFQNVVSDSFKESVTTSETELDPKKQIVLKIDIAVREMGLSLIDIYKIIDQDENQRITKSELKKLFDKINSSISDKEVTMLFQDIDNDNSGSIDYNELLAYVRNAKKEQAKIERMKRINQKVDDIRNKTGGDIREDTEQNEDLGKIDKLHLKIQMLELRDKNNNKRQEQQKEKIQTQALEIIKLEKRIQNMESDLAGVQKNYYDARQRAMAFSEKVKCCLPQDQSKQIEALKQRMITENTDLRGALRTYKALYETTIDHVKTLKLTKEKEEHQNDTLKELQKNIKDLQGESDDKALVGKLYHQLMMSRWQQGEINKKYDNKCDESQKFEITVQNLETELEENEQLLGYTHQELIQLKRTKDKEIEVISGKIIPTVTSNKIEELHNKISEMVEQKLQLEITNRQLREVNNELQLKCDFYETRKQTIEDIKQELKYNKADRHQQKIMEQGQLITELKLAEMKAKREAGMAREKEEYYMRVNRQHTETIKLMESEIAQNAQKFNEREEFWTKRVNEREHMIFKKQDEKQEAKLKERKQLEQWQENTKKQKSIMGVTEQTEGDDDDDNYGQRQRTNQSNMENNQKLQDLEQQNDNLQDDYKRLYTENQVLQNKIKKMQESNTYGARSGSGGRGNYSKDEMEELTKKAINQESEKIAQVAQKTISTLQELIDEKNMQLDKKEDVIKRMRRDFMLEKDKDIKEIRRLNEKVVNQNMSAMQRMQQSVVQQNGQIVESTQYWGDVGELITEKDQKLTEIGIRLEKEQEAHNETIKLLRKEKDITAELEDQIQFEKKRNQTGKLMKQTESLQKLVKEREKELKNVRKLMQDLRTDYTQMAEDKYNAQSLKEKVVKEDKTKIQQMDTQLKNALDHVRNTKSQLEQHKKELEEMNLQNIKLKEENTKLKQQKSDLLDDDQQKKRKSESRMASVMKGEKDTGSYNQEKKINELEEENKKLQEENKNIQKQLDFIRQQKSKEGIIDRDGNLQGEKMQFENIKELLKAIKKWEQATPGWNFMESIKEYDRHGAGRKRRGQVKLQEFYMALETGGIKLKDKDKDLVMYSDFNDKLDQIHLDQLYYAMNPNLVCANMLTEESGSGSGASALRRGSSIKTSARDDNKPKLSSRKETMDQKREQGNAQLEKKLNIVNRQLYEAKKEKDTLQNQMLNWKDKAIRLEKELQQANQNPKMASVQKRQSMTQANAIGDLKDTIYTMEDKNERLKMDIYRKDVEIQKLGEEKAKLEEELKASKLDNSKARSKLDNLMMQKMGPDQARRESQGEKDQIIRNLKEKLEIQRKKDEDTTEKYYELLSYNKELEYIKENYDIQVERLQTRIVELEEYKKLYGHKAESPPPNNTIKKGLGMSRRR